jgi:hypothetical protein
VPHPAGVPLAGRPTRLAVPLFSETVRHPAGCPGQAGQHTRLHALSGRRRSRPVCPWQAARLASHHRSWTLPAHSFRPPSNDRPHRIPNPPRVRNTVQAMVGPFIDLRIDTSMRHDIASPTELCQYCRDHAPLHRELLEVERMTCR